MSWSERLMIGTIAAPTKKREVVGSTCQQIVHTVHSVASLTIKSDYENIFVLINCENNHFPNK